MYETNNIISATNNTFSLFVLFFLNYGVHSMYMYMHCNTAYYKYMCQVLFYFVILNV